MIAIGIIFGGVGPEHEASLSSAHSIIRHIDRTKYRIELYGIAKDGSWVVGPGAWQSLYDTADKELLPTAIRENRVRTADVTVKRFQGYPDSMAFAGIDCLFPVVDGRGGEDGVLQALATLLNKPFTGSGLLASAQSYDKWTAKRLALDAGIPVAVGIKVSNSDHLDAVVARIETELRTWELVVKPVASGSSFGVSRAASACELAVALDIAFAFDSFVLIEEYIDHDELFVPVLGNPPELVVAPPVAVEPTENGFFSYYDKYIDERPMRCPAPLDKVTDRAARRMAREAYLALGCRGFARVDLFFDKRAGLLRFNELNTIPALSKDCAFPMGMANAGYNYDRLIGAVVDLALNHAPSAAPFSTSRAA